MPPDTLCFKNEGLLFGFLIVPHYFGGGGGGHIGRCLCLLGRQIIKTLKRYLAAMFVTFILVGESNEHGRL